MQQKGASDMEEKFIIYATRKSNQPWSIKLTEKTYSLLQQTKDRTHLPISTIAEMAIEFALNHVEIRYLEN